jgi:hypothetical protein
VVFFSCWRDGVVISSPERVDIPPITDELTSVLAFHGQHAFALGTVIASAESRPDLRQRWSSLLVATAAVDHVSTTIWSGGAAAGLYLGTGLILAFLVHTHYPGALGLREWIRVVLSWPLIFFLRTK